jgi:RNA-binding protein YhbY
MKGLVAPGRPLFVACGRTKLCSRVWWAAILIFGGAQEVDELVLGCVAMRREARSLQHESKSLALGSGPAFRHDARDLGGQDSLALPGSCALAVSLCASTRHWTGSQHEERCRKDELRMFDLYLNVLRYPYLYPLIVLQPAGVVFGKRATKTPFFLASHIAFTPPSLRPRCDGWWRRGADGATVCSGFHRMASRPLGRGGMRTLAILAFLCYFCSFTSALQFAPSLQPRPRSAVAVRCCEPGASSALSGKQKSVLRSHAGRLAASKSLHYVTVAEPAASAAEVDRQLAAAELVRCKFQVAKKAEAKVLAQELAEMCDAAVAEVLGHTALLYRPSEKRLYDINV